jgi:hypothetical protein
MEFSSFREPDSQNDVIIRCQGSGSSWQVPISSVPTLRAPYAFFSQDPLLPLSDTFLLRADSSLKALQFPILLDLFHSKIELLSASAPRCHQCQGYQPDLSDCPFCQHSSVAPSFWRFPATDPVPELFAFCLIGDIPQLFIDFLPNFAHPFVLLRYDGHFISYQAVQGELREFHLIDDCEIPPSAVISTAIPPLPPFRPSTLKKADLSLLVPRLTAMLASLEGVIHLIVLNSLPHTCLTDFSHPTMTFSFMTRNCVNCECKNACQRSGGAYLPHSSFFSPRGFLSVRRVSVLCNGTRTESKTSALLFPGTFLVVNSLLATVTAPIVSVQIEVETATSVFCFSRSFAAQPGLTNFLSSISTPNLLAAASARDFFTTLLKLHSKSKDSICLPFSLKYFLLFRDDFAAIRVFPSVFSSRPFAVQIIPVLRVPDFISPSLCTTRSVLLVLLERAIYVWIGVELGVDKWRAAGIEPVSTASSFEVTDVGAATDLWTTIRSIRALCAPLWIPVIAVPSESGKRVSLLEALDCDELVGSNLVLQRYGELARLVIV